MAVKQDKKGWTHIDRDFQRITPKTINWWWRNMGNGFPLWHPVDHADFYSLIKSNGNQTLGKIYVAPQVWSADTLIKPHICWENEPGMVPKRSPISKRFSRTCKG
jgi:hypothetical protein